MYACLYVLHTLVRAIGPTLDIQKTVISTNSRTNYK